MKYIIQSLLIVSLLFGSYITSVHAKDTGTHIITNSSSYQLPEAMKNKIDTILEEKVFTKFSQTKLDLFHTKLQTIDVKKLTSDTKKQAIILYLIESFEAKYKKMTAPTPESTQTNTTNTKTNTSGTTSGLKTGDYVEGKGYYVESENNEKYDNIYGNETTQEDIDIGKEQIYWGDVKNQVSVLKKYGFTLEKAIGRWEGQGITQEQMNDMIYYWKTGETR